MNILKSNTARSFGRAARTYNDSIQFQKPCAEEFASWIAVRASRPDRILEAGCGTGLLTQGLLRYFPGSRILATDLSKEMIDCCSERLAGTPVHFLVHDFDTPFEETGHDLAVASLCLQWSHNLRAAFENFAVALRPGGEFFASIPLESSLAQIRQLFYDENTQYRGITLPSLSLIEHALDGLFRNLSMETHRYTESYADLHSLLRSMRRNGTSGGNTGTPVPVLTELIRKHRTPCSAEYAVVFLKGIRI